MRDTNKEDVYVALRSFLTYIEEMSPQDFKIFLEGRPVLGAMLLPRFHLMSCEPADLHRAITRLEFRIS